VGHDSNKEHERNGSINLENGSGKHVMISCPSKKPHSTPGNAHSKSIFSSVRDAPFCRRTAVVLFGNAANVSPIIFQLFLSIRIYVQHDIYVYLLQPF
jgi:hypothetical protein